MQMRQVAPKDWTLLFYNPGDAFGGKLGTASVVDLEQVGSDSHTDVVAFNNRPAFVLDKLLRRNQEFEGARIYHVERSPEAPSRWKARLPADARSLVDLALRGPRDLRSPSSPEARPGDAASLKRFLVETMKRYPSRHVALFVSGGSMVPAQGPMSGDQLARALREAEAETGRKLDLLGLNSNFSANLEALAPLGPAASALVASEGPVFGSAQPFGRVLRHLQSDLDRSEEVDGPQLASICVEEARRQPLGNLYTGTLSALIPQKLDDVAEARDVLEKTLLERGQEPAKVLSALRDARHFDYGSFPARRYVTDVNSFASAVERRFSDPAVKEAARTLRETVKSCVLAERHEAAERESLVGKGLRLVLGRGLQESPDLGGLTIDLDETAAPDRPQTGFRQLLSQAARSERDTAPLWRRGVARVKEGNTRFLSSLASHLPQPGLAPLLPTAERMALGAVAMGTFTALSVAGIPAYPFLFGPYLAVRGLASLARETTAAVQQARAGHLSAFGKETLVEHLALASMGALGGVLGLYLLHLVPGVVALPASAAAFSLQFGKEIAKLWATRHERAAASQADRAAGQSGS